MKKIISEFNKMAKIQNSLDNQMDKVKQLLIPFLPNGLDFEVIQQTDGFCILLEENMGTNIHLSSVISELKTKKQLTKEELLYFSI